MWARTLAMILSSLGILSTSFCVQNQKVRDVSNTTRTNLSSEEEPDVIEDRNGNKLLIFSRVHPSEPVVTIHVQYQCKGATRPSDWESFNVSDYSGRSDLLEGSKVLVRYRPLGLIYFGKDDAESRAAEQAAQALVDKTYDLNVACKASS